MNKILIIASAGSGKTWGLCNHALNIVNDGRALLLTYTNQGRMALENEIRNLNKGVLHPHIKIMTWYSFLLNECIKPYQSYIVKYNTIKSISFQDTYGVVNFFSKNDVKRYIDNNKNVKSNHASELAVILNQVSQGHVIQRLQKAYSWIYIDEVQDLAGWDLEFVKALIDCKVGIYLVGDPKQGTYRTNNSQKNKNLSGRNLLDFFEEMITNSKIILERNNQTKRFNSDICSFANKIDSSGTLIESSIQATGDYEGIFLIEEKDILAYLDVFNAQCLRYDSRTKVNIESIMNYGISKGRTFERVVIYPNNTFKNFIEKRDIIKSPEKYYIAATRAKKSNVFVYKKFPKKIAFNNKLITYTSPDELYSFNMIKLLMED